MNACEELLRTHGWNLFFAYFPKFEDGNCYRIFKSHRSNQNELLGYGKSPEEAIRNASALPQTGNLAGQVNGGLSTKKENL